MKSKKVRNKILASALAVALMATTAVTPKQAKAEETTPTVTATNITFDTARDLQFNTSIAEELSWSDTKRYYKFSISEASVLDLGFKDIPHGMANFAINVYDKSRTRVFHGEGRGHAFEIAGVILTGGEYYIELVQTDAFCTHSMIAAISSLSESFKETQDSDNNSTNTANAISFGKQYKGVMACNDDKDYYKFNVPADGKVNLNLKNSTNDTLKYTIYDSANNASYINTVRASEKADETIPLIKGSYYLAVTKENDKANGSYNFTLYYTKTTVKTPTLASVKNTASKKMTVKWKGVTGATAYQVQYCTKKTFKSGVKSKRIDAPTTEATIGKLKKKKKYYVRVRAYAETNGKRIYSKWSKVKSVKIKK